MDEGTFVITVLHKLSFTACLVSLPAVFESLATFLIRSPCILLIPTSKEKGKRKKCTSSKALPINSGKDGTQGLSTMCPSHQSNEEENPVRIRRVPSSAAFLTAVS